MKKCKKIDEIMFLNKMHLYIWICFTILEILNFLFWDNDKITLMCLTCHFIILIESIAIILLIKHNKTAIMQLLYYKFKDKDGEMNENK